jgi:hypothetical protein
MVIDYCEQNLRRVPTTRDYWSVFRYAVAISRAAWSRRKVPAMEIGFLVLPRPGSTTSLATRRRTGIDGMSIDRCERQNSGTYFGKSLGRRYQQAFTARVASCTRSRSRAR